MKRLTEQERKIMEARIKTIRTPKGGFTKKGLAKIGVEWPPQKGWRKCLLTYGNLDNIAEFQCEEIDISRLEKYLVKNFDEFDLYDEQHPIDRIINFIQDYTDRLENEKLDLLSDKFIK